MPIVFIYSKVSINKNYALRELGEFKIISPCSSKNKKQGFAMIEWIGIDSHKIRKIAYNSEVKTMYIDFKGSIVDTPYAGISEEKFKLFSLADDIDEYFETHIKDVYEKVELDVANKINCKL